MKRLLAMSIAMILLVGMLVLPASSFAATQTGVVHGGWLRLRAQPNFNAYTISSYYTGTVVTILETLSGWYRVTTPDGNTGYMYSAYVNLSGGGGGGKSGGGAGFEQDPMVIVKHNPYCLNASYGFGAGGGADRFRGSARRSCGSARRSRGSAAGL